MDSTLKLGAAAAGGYLLGRTKKGKAAVSLALWATGKKYRVRDLARERVVKLATSKEGQELIAQLRGPALAAVLALYEARASSFADGLEQRISSASGKVVDALQERTSDGSTKVADGAKKVTGTLTKAREEQRAVPEQGADGASPLAKVGKSATKLTRGRQRRETQRGSEDAEDGTSQADG